MRELILEACRHNDFQLFSELKQTFPQDLIDAEFNELRELGTQYRHEFQQLNLKWEHRFSVKWHGEWVNGLRLVSPPVESSNSQVRCQAWRFESLEAHKYYAWAEEFWRENLPSAVVTLHAGQKTLY